MVTPTKDIEIGAAFGIGVDTLDHLIGLIVGVRPNTGDLLVFAVLLLDQVAPLVIGEGGMGLPTVAGLLRDLIQITFHYPPTLVRDRLRKIQPMQWSARAGRKILHTQMGAALLSALVLTAVNLTVYAVPFLMKGPLRFADCGLDGLWAWGTPWFDWTYGTYLLVLAAMILLLSLGAAGLTVFLSLYSGNYVSMLLKALPLFIVTGPILGSWLLDMPFHFRCWWENGPWAPRGAELMILFPLLLLDLGLCSWTCQRQTQRELL